MAYADLETKNGRVRTEFLAQGVSNLVKGTKLLGSEAMSLEKWAKIRDNPYQRDTERHAKKADHLNTFEASHAKVVLAIMPDGTYVKVDGHTRCKKWLEGSVDFVPSYVVADVYYCESDVALRRLYYQHDGQGPVQDSCDIMYGLSKQSGINFQSSLLRNGEYSSAIVSLWHMLHSQRPGKRTPELLNRCVNELKEELKIFDSTEPKHGDYTAAFVSGALLTIMAYPEKAKQFWTLYNSNAGNKLGNECDGVQAARNLLADIKAKKKKKTGTYYHKETVGKIVNAFEAWKSNVTYRGKGGIPHAKTDKGLKEFIRFAIRAQELRL